MRDSGWWQKFQFRTAQSRIVFVFWVAALIAVPVWASLASPGWDAATLLKVGHAVRLGQDPYLNDIDTLTKFEKATGTRYHPPASVPLTFVYPPITLPLLSFIARFPDWCCTIGFCVLYFAAVMAQLRFGSLAIAQDEQKSLGYFVPVAAFFPGLLASDCLIGGNVAFLLYGVTLGAAIAGFKGKGWRWFYVAVVFAACFKPPLLLLTLIPLLSARKQWISALATIVAGVSIFAVQPYLFPSLFKNYLISFQLVFGMNRDFGVSPAGMFAGLLFDRGRAFTTPSYLLYLAYAIPLLGILVQLSRRYLRGAISLEQWLPVLATGVILMNPRVMEYDVEPLAILMAILLWRFVSALAGPARTAFIVVPLFLMMNVFAAQDWLLWKNIESILVVVVFTGGCWSLMQESDRFVLESEAGWYRTTNPKP